MDTAATTDRRIGQAPTAFDALDRLEAALVAGADIKALLAAQTARIGGQK